MYVTQKHFRIPVVIANELHAFSGINLLMGNHSLLAKRHYWSDDVDLKGPLVSDDMPRNSYQHVLANLHVNYNYATPESNTDKLYKIRPFVDALNNSFMPLYNVNEPIDDESMILIKVRSSVKQYNPMEPIKQDQKI